MSETLYAVLDADGMVENVIVADADFVATLTDAIADPDNDTGDYTADHKFVDITDKDPQPSVGWTRAKNGVFSAPTPAALTEDEQAEADAAQAANEAAAAQQAADHQRLLDLRDKAAAGTALTQEERDWLQVYQLLNPAQG